MFLGATGELADRNTGQGTAIAADVDSAVDPEFCIEVETLVGPEDCPGEVVEFVGEGLGVGCARGVAVADEDVA